MQRGHRLWASYYYPGRTEIQPLCLLVQASSSFNRVVGRAPNGVSLRETARIPPSWGWVNTTISWRLGIETASGTLQLTVDEGYARLPRGVDFS